MNARQTFLTRRRVLALSGTAFLAAAGARAKTPAIVRSAPATQQITGEAFATTWRVTVPDSGRPEALRGDIEALLAGIDRMMSPWRTDSEISAFNAAGAGGRPVSAETAFVADAALDIAIRSDGWFDPSVGPLVARFGFGPITGETAEEGAPPLWHALAVDGNRLEKTQGGVTMDLCGIAKGRALDLMAERLLDAGHTDFLIDLGGELVARGNHPAGRPWQVAVEDPRLKATGGAGVLKLADGAVATSGLRAQSYTLSGHSYSHIIDPRHAVPVEGAIASVSVLAPDAMTADGWATALTAAGGNGPALARNRAISALFLFHDGEGLRRETTGGFSRFLL
ncbi:FAD:protein FMN transferase [Martelella mangrovi]|uniref:FAD:protein FMN transferase n=1 Tax=Martelella mangrovi TaxID=1397477 RepID=A0ABV2I5A6_9HYPH